MLLSLFLSAGLSCAMATVEIGTSSAVLTEKEPLLWTQEPHARLSHTATMAVELFDGSNTQYWFECTEDDSHSSEWQSEPSYEVGGLTPETEYTFTAKVRHAESGDELRTPTRPMTVTTRKADPPDGRQVDCFDAILMNEVELVPIMVNGGKDNRINIVVVNRWTAPGNETAYNRPELREEFIEDVRAIVRGFTLGHEDVILPLGNYRDFFNLYALWWPSSPPWDPEKYDEGENTVHWSVYNEIRDRLFLPWQSEDKGWVTHLAMFNGDGGGGGAGLLMDKRVGDAMIVGNALPDFIHEFAHTAFNIGDEYTSTGFWGASKRGYPENSSVVYDYRRDLVKWRAWIEPDTPIPTPYERKYLGKVGVFEGGESRLVNVYRAVAQGCLMGAGSAFGADEFCPVCRQTAVKRIYHLVNPIERTTPVQKQLTLKQPGELHFSVQRLKPEPDTQKVAWHLNGECIATGVDEIDVTVGDLPAYELVYSITDETDYIRPDPPYAEFPRTEVRWRVENRDQGSGVGDQGSGRQCNAPILASKSNAVVPDILPPDPNFTLDSLQFEAVDGDRVRIVSPDPALRYLWYERDFAPYVLPAPLGNYVGTFTAADGQVFPAEAIVRPTRAGTVVGEERDFRSWLYLQAWTEGRERKPLWFSFDTDMTDRHQKELHVQDTSEDAEGKGRIAEGRLNIEVTGPLPGRFDLRYTTAHEESDEPLRVGTEFQPLRPGNYYVAAQCVDTEAISFNRIGVSVAMGPCGLASDELAPDQVKSARPLLWLDACDVDGDGVAEPSPLPRGAIMGWRGKADDAHWGSEFVYYQPNAQNGRPVASWETIWLQSLAKPITGYQTVILAYRDHSFSKPGTGPWGHVPLWIWDLGQHSDATVEVPEALKNAHVRLNGEPIGPWATSAPMEFCVASFEYDSPLDTPIHRTDTHWEGAIGEILVFDGKLSEAEQQGVEGYLWRKWVAGVHLPGSVGSARRNP